MNHIIRNTVVVPVLRAVVAVAQVAAGLSGLLIQDPSPARADANPGGTSATQITGTVFQDFNANGVMNTTGITPNLAIDVGVSGVRVSAFISGSLSAAAVATSTATGAYTLTGLTAGTLYRLELSNLPRGYFPTAFGLSGSTTTPSNGTTTQFVSAGTSNASFGINTPGEYCKNNPQLIASCMVQGAINEHPTITDTLRSYDWGIPRPASNTVAPYTPVAQRGLLGSTYGLAEHGGSGQVFAAAYLRRHAALGANGLGAIYLVDPAVPGGNERLFADLNAISPSVAGSITRTAATNYYYDEGVFTQVGKTGLGGIDVSDDGGTLYVVNMSDRRLYQLDSGVLAQASPTLPVSTFKNPAVTIPTAACSNAADARPMAVKFYRGLVYVGVTCSAESTVTAGTRGDASQLRAVVYAFDPLTQAFDPTPKLNIPLGFARGCTNPVAFTTNTTTTGALCFPAQFLPWQPNWRVVYNLTPPGPVNQNSFYIEYPQPLFADIDFDRGNMLIGIRDLNGDRTGYCQGPPDLSFTPNPACVPANGPRSVRGNGEGDVFRACGNPQSGWTLESNGSCGGVTPTDGTYNGVNNQQGPGGGEYYWNDQGPGGPNGGGGLEGHSNVGIGSIAQLPGANEVATSMMDTLTYYDAGIAWFNHATGASPRRIEVYQESAAHFGKANGLGDLELLCGSAPIEIGNRVWRDDNNNGVQDPGEPGLSGVVVSLTLPSSSVITTTTDANGQYLFTREAPTGAFSTTLRANTIYTLTFPPQIVSGGLNYGLTVQNATGEAGNSPITDTIDSDPDPATRQIVLRTGGPGENNHGFDAGYSQAVLNLGNRVWFDTNNDGFDNDTAGVSGVVLALYTSAGAYVSQTTTNANGYYTFTRLTPGAYTVVVSPTNFAAGGVLEHYQSSTPTNLTPDANIDLDDNGIVSGTLGAGGLVRSNVITLTAFAEPSALFYAGDANWTLDFGFYRQQVGNTIWVDSNDNGLLDGAEAPYTAGPITVTLIDNATSAVVSSTVTNNGVYTFVNVPSGTFVVSITVPSGFRSSTPTTNTAGVDNNDNGSASGAFIVSAPFTATPGTTLGAITANGANGTTVNPTIDFGLYQIPPTPTPTPTATPTATATNTPTATPTPTATNTPVPTATDAPTSTPVLTEPPTETVVPTSTPVVEITPTDTATPVPTPQLASLGDYTWVDANRNGRQDADEQPLANVPVTLRGPSITLTTTTSITGYYRFDGLTPGVPYVVVFGSVPGYQLTTNSGDVDVPDNSDANPRTGESLPVTLLPGEHNPRVDAGYFTDARQSSALTIAKRSLNTGTVRAGNLITYEIVVRNIGDTLATNVVLTDPIPAGTTYVAGSASPAAAFTGQAVVWTLGEVAARNTVTVRFVVRVSENSGAGVIRNVARVTSNDTTETLTSNEVTTVFQPTAIALDAFSVVPDEARGGASALVRWRTALELDSAGFIIWRSTTGSRLDAVRVNDAMMPARNPSGASYELVDPQGNQPGASYWIEEVGLSGLSSWHGPVVLGAVGIQPPPPQVDLAPIPFVDRSSETTPAPRDAVQRVVASEPAVVATQVVAVPGAVLVPAPVAAPAAEATRAPAIASAPQSTARPRAVSIGDAPVSEYAPTALPARPTAAALDIMIAQTPVPADESGQSATQQMAQNIMTDAWLLIAAAASLGAIAIVSGISMALLTIRRRR